MSRKSTARKMLIAAMLAAGALLGVERGWAQEPVPQQPLEITLAVSSFATNATAAHAASGLAVQRVMRAVAQSGVELVSVETGNTLIVPEYARPDPVPLRGIRDEPRIVGYRAVGEVVVRTLDAAHVGLLLDFARGAGANEMRPLVLP